MKKRNEELQIRQLQKRYQEANKSIRYVPDDAEARRILRLDEKNKIKKK